MRVYVFTSTDLNLGTLKEIEAQLLLAPRAFASFDEAARRAAGIPKGAAIEAPALDRLGRRAWTFYLPDVGGAARVTEVEVEG
jgi:hypothetical protein